MIVRVESSFPRFESANLHFNRTKRSLIMELSYEPTVALDPNINCNTFSAHKVTAVSGGTDDDLITDGGQEQCGDAAV